MGRFSDALEQFDAALAISPRHLVSLNSKGQVFLQMGGVAAALEQFDAALAINPRDAVTLNSKGQALLQMGRFSDALSQFDATLAIYPHDVVALNSKGLILLRQGELPNALAVLEESRRLDPSDQVTKMLLARYYLLAGDEAKATPVILELIRNELNVTYLWLLCSLAARHPTSWARTFDTLCKLALDEQPHMTAQVADMQRHVQERRDPNPELIYAAIGEYARSKIFLSSALPRPIDRVARRVADPRPFTGGRS
jgi:tetratricopeptide (TPR) repeat protein